MAGSKSGFDEPGECETWDRVARDVFKEGGGAGGIVIDGTNDPPTDPPEGMAYPLYCTRRDRWVEAARYSGVLYVPPLTEADSDFSKWDRTRQDVSGE